MRLSKRNTATKKCLGIIYVIKKKERYQMYLLLTEDWINSSVEKW